MWRKRQRLIYGRRVLFNLNAWVGSTLWNLQWKWVVYRNLVEDGHPLYVSGFE